MIVPAYHIALFVPFVDAEPRGDPAGRPLGRLALEMQRKGIELVFCTFADVHLPDDDTPHGAAGEGQPGTVRHASKARPAHGTRVAVDGVVARPGRWLPIQGVGVDAGYVRTASLQRLRPLPAMADRFQRNGLPLVNTPSLVDICRDKARFVTIARNAGLPAPETETDPEQMAERLLDWGDAWLKPRFGARGRGVVHLRAEDDLVVAETGEGATSIPLAGLHTWFAARSRLEPHLLQRGVRLPAGDFTALSIRSLVQRDPAGRWTSRPPVLRMARSGVAGNVSRGADVALLAEVPFSIGGRTPDRLAGDVRVLDARVMAAIDTALGPLSPLAVEVGLDYVPDHRGRLWVIEANDTPQGRLEHVSRLSGPHSDLEKAWLQALAAPIDYLVNQPAMLARACRRDRRDQLRSR